MHARALRLSRAIALVGIATLACRSPRRSTLSKAGDDRDDGAGLLAQASLRLATPDDGNAEEDGFIEHRATSSNYDYVYGGGMYGGDPYGGFAYGGAGYAGWSIPQWSYNVPNRMPPYTITGGLTGAVEGTVTWNGAPPSKVTSACGPIDNPTLRVGTDKAARGVLVYIEKITVGRSTPYYVRPAGIGGVVAKRGCTLVPAAQIVTPLPGSITIHGDENRTKIRFAEPDKAKQPSMHDLQEGGLVALEIKAGVTRIDSDDNRLSAAWVIGIDSPYYAITDDAGRYRIDELGPGSYELTFWQPPVASAASDGTWSYGNPIVVKKTIKVTTSSKASQLSVALPGR